jgi:hypothetical protein
MDDQKFKAKLRTVQRHRKKLLAVLLSDLQIASSLCDDQFTPSRLVDILVWLQEPLSDADRELIRAAAGLDSPEQQQHQ